MTQVAWVSDVNENQRAPVLGQRIADPVGGKDRVVLDLADLAGALEMVGQSQAGGVEAVGLDGDVAGYGAAMDAPIVEDLWDVDDFFGLFGQAEDVVVILAAVTGRVEAADLLGQDAGKHGQMADVVIAAEIVQGKIRLEMDQADLGDVAGKIHFIAVDQVSPLADDGLVDCGQGLGCEQIVVVQQGDKVAAGHGEGGIGIAGNTQVLGQALVGDPVVLGGQSGDLRLDTVLITAVGEAELPMGVCLGLDRGDHRGQMVRLGIVERHDDRKKQRCITVLLLPCRCQRLRLPQAGLEYMLVIDASPAVRKLYPKNAGSLAGQDGQNTAPDRCHFLELGKQIR